jgi:hypothetical protein
MLVGNVPYDAFGKGKSVGLSAGQMDSDGGMEVEEGLNDMCAVAGNCIQQQKATMKKFKLSPVDRMSHEMAVAVVLAHNPQCPIGSNVHRRPLRVGPTGNAKLFPHLALVYTINAHGVMGRCGTNIGAHNTILVRIDTRITDDTLRGYGPFKTQQITMGVGELMVRARWPDIHDDIMAPIASHHIA